MHPRREAQSSLPFLLNSVDRLGRPIDPAVLSSAQEIAYRAVGYAERLQVDPAVAASFLEEAAATVSGIVAQRRAQAEPPVRDLAAYLFRTFLRMIDDERHKTLHLEQALTRSARSDVLTAVWTDAEIGLLLNELMATCDRVAREIVLRHLEGFSWEEIGARYGLSSHAAEARFRRAIEHARKTLKIPRPRG